MVTPRFAAADLAKTRAAELAAALAVLGAEPPILLGYPDGFLRDHGAALRERLGGTLRLLEGGGSTEARLQAAAEELRAMAASLGG